MFHNVSDSEKYDTYILSCYERVLESEAENIRNCAVLVECGFLTNEEECEKLSDKDYQRQLSFSIFCGMMEYMERKK